MRPEPQDDRRPERESALALLDCTDWRTLAPLAGELRDRGFGSRVTYSRKIFVPLTHLCRDVCHYCTFAKTPRRIPAPYLIPEEVLSLAERGAAAGCKEALFTLGEKPELRYAAARRGLAELGFDSTLDYLEHVAGRVVRETGLLPHLNPGLLSGAQLARLKRVSASMGLMLESVSERLGERGAPHHGSPDKAPARRLESLKAAAQARVPMTSGILIGIGETRRERIDSLLALRSLADAGGHIQELIIQNFRAKPGTKMHAAPEPSADELCWTVAVARILFGSSMSIQAPPNLYPGDLPDLIRAGINDWGGVSPVTPDHVNPEAPWPELDRLADETGRAGFNLVERLTVYPRFIHARAEWLAPELIGPVLRLSDAEGLARVGSWCAGSGTAASAADLAEVDSAARRPSPASPAPVWRDRGPLRRLGRAAEPTEQEIAALFGARGRDFDYLVAHADRLREEAVGDTVTYAVVRNINYTNVCAYKCGFCAFSKGRTHESLRGQPYLLDRAEIERRVREAWERGATEVCMQGGIHPSFTGTTYLDILAAAKAAVPAMHVHAFSPLEVHHGARTLGISVREFLETLRSQGLGSLPGTAAEILDDEVRRQIAPDKLRTDEWLEVVETAHRVGLPTTATIMFGHVEGHLHWARHLLRLRRLQARTGGITEFVPLPFVHMEAPMYLRGLARRGPTLREAILMHAVARWVLHPMLRNVQASWTKLGPVWAQRCLTAGANDLGGTLMNESISRAAGAAHGQELAPEGMEALIESIGRRPVQRTTLYRPVSEERRARAFGAPALAPAIAKRILRFA